MLLNILIGRSRLCRNGPFCTDDPGILKYPHNGGNFHDFSQRMCHFVVRWDIFVQQHGGLLCKQTANSCCKSDCHVNTVYMTNRITDICQGGNYVSGLDDKKLNFLHDRQMYFDECV